MIKWLKNLISNFDVKKTAATIKIKVRNKRPQRSPKKKVEISNKPIEYLLNDMTTPNLIKVMDAPPAPSIPLSVRSYHGGGFDRNSVQAQAANCYVTVTNTLNFYSKHAIKPLKQWAGTNVLLVMPRAGTDLNAYYDRRSLRFFYFGHAKIGGTVYTADSSDIVAHELGHAIFDSYRPDTWGAASLEVWSFHEAFADLTAIMNILSHDEVLEAVIRGTNGNLYVPNVASSLAEHVGNAIFKVTNGAGNRSSKFLRSAINDFKYVNPSTLPERASNDKLAAECHSFGRVFLGAYYEILVMMYESEKKEGKAPVEALKSARDTLAKYSLKSICHAPLSVNFYESMAKTMLWADVTMGNKKYHNKMRYIFMSRNLIKQEVKLLSAPSCDNDDCIVKFQSNQTLKLKDHLVRSQSDESNPLYDVEIEVPAEQCYLYDNDKNILDIVSSTNEEILAGAQDMISFLHKTNSVSDEESTPFAIKDGKLVRTHFV